MSANVVYYTRLAGEKLHKRQDEDAVDTFREALKYARESHDADDICKCTLNLGAALVRLGRFSEGLKVLESVIPSQCDHLLTGDRWYNLCLAHEHLDNNADAIKCIQLAIECYGESKDSEAVLLKAGSACRLASLYTKLREFDKSAEAYADAASSYGVAENVPQQAICLFHQSQLLGCCEKSVDAIDVADKCVELCSKQSEARVDIAQLLNDVGLLYAQLKEHKKALLCFESAQKIFQWNIKDRMLEAVVLQNTGAIHNCLKNYEQSIDCNRQASEIYAQLNYRSLQGQCLCNMAYAYSQLPDIEMAGEYYLHALQAAKDTGDKNGEYKALEGLSSVAYHQQKYDRSCEHLTNALNAVASADTTQSPAARCRIINKLKGVMKTQLRTGSQAQHTDQQPSVCATDSDTITVDVDRTRLVPADYLIDANSRSATLDSEDNTSRPVTTQESLDTDDKQMVKQETSKQPTRGNDECDEKSDRATEQGSDDEDDSENSSDSSESDSDNSDQTVTGKDETSSDAVELPKSSRRSSKESQACALM